MGLSICKLAEISCSNFEKYEIHHEMNEKEAFVAE